MFLIKQVLTPKNHDIRRKSQELRQKILNIVYQNVFVMDVSSVSIFILWLDGTNKIKEQCKNVPDA